MDDESIQDSDRRDQKTVSRREILQAAGTGGAFLGGIASFSSVVGAVGNGIKIVTLAHGDKALQTEIVDKNWYNHTKKAEKAKRKLSKQLQSRSDLRSIGIGKGNRHMGGLESHVITVGIAEDGDKSSIPNEIDGIPVIVEKTPMPEPSCYTGRKSTIHGGIGCYANERVDGYGTLCCRVFKNSNEYILTARHLFENDKLCGNHNPVGENLMQGSNDVVGQVRYSYQNSDSVLVDGSSTNRRFTDAIAATYGHVVGRVTKNGLNHLKSNNSRVRKRGRTTCRTHGHIKKIQQEYFCGNGNYIGGIVRSSATNKNGDSGGPVFYKKSNSSSNIWIVNMTSYYPNDGSHDTNGSSANHMSHNQGVTWGGNPYNG